MYLTAPESIALKAKGTAALVAAMLVCLTAGRYAEAGSIIVNVDTELVTMTLTGPADVPLGSDPSKTHPDSQDGFLPVRSFVTITESPTLTSAGNTVIVMNLDTSDMADLRVTGTLDSSFDFFLDLQIDDDDDAFDFGADLGNSVSLPADPAQPLTVTLSSTFDFSLNELLAGSDLSFGDLGVVTSSTTVKYLLGADVNENTYNDVLKLTASGLDFGLDELSFSDTAILIDENDLLDFFSGNLAGDLEIGFTGSLGITSTTLAFDGLVLDENTDPPFTMTVSGATSVPEPSTFVLAALGLLGFLGSGWRRRR